MKKIVLVVEPMSPQHSVMFDFAESIAVHLKKCSTVTVASTILDKEKKMSLNNKGIGAVSLGKLSLPLDALLRKFGEDNESMLWLESWLTEALFGKNGAELMKILQTEDPDIIINATNTISLPADLWWILGLPLITTLLDISADNYMAKMAVKFGNAFISGMDRKLTFDMARNSRRIVASGQYCYDQYASFGINLEKNIVYGAPDFDSFRPTTRSPKRNFVLAYIGKETELEAISEMARKGIKIIAFGSKLPMGTKLEAIQDLVEFRGFVNLDELVDLYSNAMFTAFPFTNETLGRVPIESMACGTPVLTYNKQGPSETVVNNETGWLADNRKELVEKALTLWKSGSTGISQSSCESRAAMFGARQSAASLMTMLGIN